LLGPCYRTARRDDRRRRLGDLTVGRGGRGAPRSRAAAPSGESFCICVCPADAAAVSSRIRSAHAPVQHGDPSRRLTHPSDADLSRGPARRQPPRSADRGAANLPSRVADASAPRYSALCTLHAAAAVRRNSVWLGIHSSPAFAKSRRSPSERGQASGRTPGRDAARRAGPARLRSASRRVEEAQSAQPLQT
jgi:hypothetical protein